VAVAEALAADHDVTLTTDANAAGALADADTLLVGADAVLPDGSVVNKVGTRTAATVAAREGVPVVVACASAKVAPAGTEGFDAEPRDPAELYDGDAPVTVVNPTFDRTPAALVDVVATERGTLDAAAIRSVADAHAGAAAWDAASGG
jgi:translation initiation factor 2B subunit (eIF-2B alpha/beta/delta family)